jgi:hypothetical protein
VRKNLCYNNNNNDNNGQFKRLDILNARYCSNGFWLMTRKGFPTVRDNTEKCAGFEKRIEAGTNEIEFKFLAHC